MGCLDKLKRTCAALGWQETLTLHSDIAIGSANQRKSLGQQLSVCIRRWTSITVRLVSRQCKFKSQLQPCFCSKSCSLWRLSCDFVPHKLMKHSVVPGTVPPLSPNLLWSLALLVPLQRQLTGHKTPIYLLTPETT